MLNFVHLNRNLEPSYSFIFQLNRTGLDAVLLKIILNKIILMRGPRSKARAVLEKAVQLSRLPRKMHGRKKNVRKKEEGDKTAVMWWNAYLL